MIFPAWNYRPSASSWCLLVRRPGRFATHGQDWLGGGQGCLVSGAANVEQVVPSEFAIHCEVGGHNSHA
jgi:hypothetical protein